MHVASYVSNGGKAVQESREARAKLEGLVRDFDRDVVANTRRIRGLLDENPRQFCSCAVEVLKPCEETRATQCVLSMLTAGGLISALLCDPALNLQQALTLARVAARMDPKIDVALAKQLADSATQSEDGVRAADVPRLTEILAAISDGTRILPSLSRLLRASNPRLRSKVVVLMGRGNRSVKWLRDRLNEPDPRVRASAVEALWGVDTEAAREILLAATQDRSHRVVGNALLGLHRLGDSSAIPLVLKMAASESRAVRLTATWVMGETRDPRFLEVLARMLRETNSAIRSRAFAALGQIKAAAAQSRHSALWRVGALFPEAISRDGLRRVYLALTTEDGQEFPKIAATHLLLSEEGKAVASYRLIEHPLPPGIAVLFVFPRPAKLANEPWNQTVLRYLEAKRRGDLWAMAPYIPTDDPEAKHIRSDFDLPHFTPRVDALEALFSQPKKRAECTDFWNAIWRSTQSEGGTVRAKRHVIVYNLADTPKPADYAELTQTVIDACASFQVISAVPSPALEEFCSRVGGTFQIASDAELPESLELACTNLMTRYEIHYEPVAGEARSLKIRVCAPNGFAEASVPIPRNR